MSAGIAFLVSMYVSNLRGPNPIQEYRQPSLSVRECARPEPAKRSELLLNRSKRYQRYRIRRRAQGKL